MLSQPHPQLVYIGRTPPSGKKVTIYIRWLWVSTSIGCVWNGDLWVKGPLSSYHSLKPCSFLFMNDWCVHFNFSVSLTSSRNRVVIFKSSWLSSSESGPDAFCMNKTKTWISLHSLFKNVLTLASIVNSPTEALELKISNPSAYG